jgi:hypothetical protein
MSIVIKNPQIEGLARRIADLDGTSVETVLCDSVLALAGRRGVIPEKRPALRDRLAALAREVDAMPRGTDRRSDDEILGYDERGQW